MPNNPFPMTTMQWVAWERLALLRLLDDIPEKSIEQIVDACVEASMEKFETLLAVAVQQVADECAEKSNDDWDVIEINASKLEKMLEERNESMNQYNNDIKVILGEIIEMSKLWRA